VSEILVVKLGGTTIAEQSHVLADVAAVARRRPVVLVHGGGKRITEWLERLGVPSKFEGGLRVTDQQSLEVAAAVLRGVVNSELVSALRDAVPASAEYVERQIQATLSKCWDRTAAAPRCGCG